MKVQLYKLIEKKQGVCYDQNFYYSGIIKNSVCTMAEKNINLVQNWMYQSAGGVCYETTLNLMYSYFRCYRLENTMTNILCGLSRNDHDLWICGQTLSEYRATFHLWYFFFFYRRTKLWIHVKLYFKIN